ncbi:hypothetical protein XELAEV_18033586mg [Xenopus laevis]|uniref:Propionate--CoA ligase n=1 Tax=Xenopus laevis TaxID=8355 RepID=A0A974CL34_XENLA|nr:hypothetical protein XELAEV_18033586mg [Xenopus laevis]
MPSQVRGREEEDDTWAEDATYPPPALLQRQAHVPDFSTYTEMYNRSVHNPQEFWLEVASGFYWKSSPSGKVLDYNFDITKGKIFVEFMKGAKTNVCYNVLDRNVMEKNLGDKTAFFWEGNSPTTSSVISYLDLLKQVCKFANVLIKLGVKKGDRVAIYLPMIPELVYAMLACARIGAVHSIVFAGFSSESLCERILDSQCVVLVTADGVFRGEKPINLKQIADEALQKCKEKMHHVKNCVVVKHLKGRLNNQNEGKFQTAWNSDVDRWLDELMADASDECEPEWLDAEDPLFILYTSGSTGKPKGVLHTVAGYLLYTALTFKYVFDYHEDDIYWSTADIGWITGHSYIVYGPLANGATSVMGGHVVTPLPAATPLKPGSATFPFFGVVPAVLNEHGKELEGEAEGYLVFKQPWPSIMRTLYGNHERYENTYFKKFPGYYVAGDGCRRDKDGYIWITGRIDDMLNVSGHLLSTAEVEAALTEHPAVAEAAVVSRPHQVKGECIYCFIILKDGMKYTERIAEELKKQVREKIGPIATPDFIQNAPGLPKTRSGKIMRRVLRQIARNEKDLGDTSTLADPSIVEVLFSQRCEAAA